LFKFFFIAAGGQAGAVDEESFIEAFEDVKKVNSSYIFIYSKTTFAFVVARNLFRLLTQHPPFLKCFIEAFLHENHISSIWKGVFLVSY
jgi:hypothetical protein